MVIQGIIAAVEDHSDWVNFLVIRENPNGRLGVCLNSKDLSNAIKREHYPVPTVDDITPRLYGYTLLAKLDAMHVY